MGHRRCSEKHGEYVQVRPVTASARVGR
jgi:hypothetical protein